VTRRHLLQPSAVSGPARDGSLFPCLLFIRTLLARFSREKRGDRDEGLRRGGGRDGLLSKCVSLLRIKQVCPSLLFSMSMSNKHFGKIIKRANPRRKNTTEYPSQCQVKHSMTREQNETKLRTVRIELAVIAAGIITHIRRLL